jgi:hypothetical protein
MTAIMSDQSWEEVTVDNLPEEYEQIIASYPAVDDELAVWKSWKELGEWSDWALCAEVDPELWYPHENANLVNDAKAICEGCPVREECLLDAIDRDDPWGIWGGLTYPERITEMIRRELTPSSSMAGDGTLKTERHFKMRGKRKADLVELVA